MAFLVSSCPFLEEIAYLHISSYCSCLAIAQIVKHKFESRLLACSVALFNDMGMKRMYIRNDYANHPDYIPHPQVFWGCAHAQIVDTRPSLFDKWPKPHLHVLTRVTLSGLSMFTQTATKLV